MIKSHNEKNGILGSLPLQGIQSTRKKNNAHNTTSYNSQTDNFVGPSGESRTMTGNAIISGKDLLMMALVRFYKQNNNQNMFRIIPIIEGNCTISLRLIDWFVTNFSKKYNTIISRTKKSVEGMEYFNVYISYRQQLKAFSKQQFDPFRRRDRIRFVYDKDNNWVETTIGQLNFFKWVLQNNILDYIVSNIEMIEADMITTQKLNTKPKEIIKTSKKPASSSKDIVMTSINENKSEKKKRTKKSENEEKNEEKKSIKKLDEPKIKNKGKNKVNTTRKQSRIDMMKVSNIGHFAMKSDDTRIGPKVVTFD